MLGAGELRKGDRDKKAKDSYSYESTTEASYNRCLKDDCVYNIAL